VNLGVALWISAWAALPGPKVAIYGGFGAVPTGFDEQRFSLFLSTYLPFAVTVKVASTASAEDACDESLAAAARAGMDFALWWSSGMQGAGRVLLGGAVARGAACDAAATFSMPFLIEDGDTFYRAAALKLRHALHQAGFVATDHAATVIQVEESQTAVARNEGPAPSPLIVLGVAGGTLLSPGTPRMAPGLGVELVHPVGSWGFGLTATRLFDSPVETEVAGGSLQRSFLAATIHRALWSAPTDTFYISGVGELGLWLIEAEAWLLADNKKHHSLSIVPSVAAGVRGAWRVSPSVELYSGPLVEVFFRQASVTMRSYDLYDSSWVGLSWVLGGAISW
jgi:hypothetical protein